MSIATRRFIIRVAATIFVVALPQLVSAQGTIAGLLTDSSGAVLPGVAVEAASPVLIEKTRTVVTDSDGRYTIVDTPGFKLSKPDMGGIATFSQAYIRARGKTGGENAM
jgi:hypothetical protein